MERYIFLVWLALVDVLERNGDVGGYCVGDVGEDVGQECNEDVGGVVLQSICVCVQRPCQSGGGGGDRWRRNK